MFISMKSKSKAVKIRLDFEFISHLSNKHSVIISLFSYLMIHYDTHLIVLPHL